MTTLHSKPSPVVADYPPRTASPLSEPDQYSSSHNEEDEASDSTWYSSDEYDYDDEADSRRQRPAGRHLVVDTDTMRLPSGRIISSRGTAGPSNPSHVTRRRQYRRKSPGLLEEEEQDEPPADNKESAQHTSSSRSSSRSASPETSALATTTGSSPPMPPTAALSKREAKRNRAVTTQYQRLRISDQQTVARLPFAEQRALLATTQKAVEGAQREGQRFTGKMDSLGNIKVSERFVNDVPGGKAHKNRFFAR